MASRDAPADARRLSEARQGSHTGCPGVPASAATNAPPQRLDVRALAGRPAVAHHGPGVGQPDVAGVLRHRDSSAHRRTSARRRSALASRVAGLAGSGVYGSRLESESDASLIVTSATYRQSSNVTPELLTARSVQPAARARTAIPRGWRNRPRYRAGGERSA